MLPEYKDLILENNRQQNRFELPIDDTYAFISYQDRGDIIYLMHTEVPESLEGKGVASALAEKAFAYLSESQLKVRIYCSYLATWILRHPEYASMVVQ